METREEWILEQEKRKLLQDQLVTENKKNKFIKEIKNGLGEKILKSTNKKKEKLGLWSTIKKSIGWN